MIVQHGIVHAHAWTLLMLVSDYQDTNCRVRATQVIIDMGFTPIVSFPAPNPLAEGGVWGRDYHPHDN